MDASDESVGPDPKISTVRNSPAYWNANLVDSMSLAVFCGKINAQGMFGSLRREIVTSRVVDRIVPAKMQPRIIIAIIRFALPIARQSYCVRSFIEASVTDQLRGQSALHAFEHEFIELAIKHRTNLTLDLIGMDINARSKRISAVLRAKHRMAKKINSAENQSER